VLCRAINERSFSASLNVRRQRSALLSPLCVCLAVVQMIRQQPASTSLLVRCGTIALDPVAAAAAAASA